MPGNAAIQKIRSKERGEEAAAAQWKTPACFSTDNCDRGKHVLLKIILLMATHLVLRMFR